jgi:hypothetical protein
MEIDSDNIQNGEIIPEVLNEPVELLHKMDYHFLYPFMNKMAHHNDCRAGYIDELGNIIIEPRYTYAEKFSDGFAIVSEGEKFYYIDLFGKNTFGKVFEEASPFSCGRAVIKDADDNYAIINTNGETIAAIGKANSVRVSAYSDDMLCIEFINENKYGYADLKGNIVIPPTYDYATDFSEGYAVVSFYDQFNIQIINKHGGIVLSTDYPFDVIRYKDKISEGLLCVNSNSGDGSGYIDVNGNIAIPFHFKYTSAFTDGLARVCDKNGLWGFIDKSGEYIIKPQFEMAGDFNEGIAAVYKTDAQNPDAEYYAGFINRDGVLIIDYAYKTFYSPYPMEDLSVLIKCNGLIDAIWESEGHIWRGYINDKSEKIFRVKQY